MSYPFIGGFGRLRMAPSTVADFDATPEPTDMVTFEDTEYIPDGSSLPEVETQTAEVGNDQEGPVGEAIPFDVRFNGLEATDVDKIRDDGYQLIPYDFEFTSEDGRTIVILRKVIPIVHTNALADANEYGYVQIMGRGRNQPSGVEPRYEVTRVAPTT